MTWTTAEARSVPCPQCGVRDGVPCIYSGKGKTKATSEGRSHQARIDFMVERRRAEKGGTRPKASTIPKVKPVPLEQPVIITGALYRKGATSF